VQPPPVDYANAPLEVGLAFGVRTCRTCTYFWPTDKAQPYGPFPAFDLPINDPGPGQATGDEPSFPWLKVVTQPASFPDPEIMDGCRKAPIMTIGINPNLTAFAPGPTGASWAYPSFTSDGGTDEWAKYASYYRYRSIYQERFDLTALSQYLVPDGQIKAAKAGVLVSALRPTDSPSYTVVVRYDGDAADTTFALAGEIGTPRWVVLVNPRARFNAGDLLASKLDVPAGVSLQTYRQRVGYYQQFVPVLTGFESYLRQRGYTGRSLQMGEDVGQLDMVACASPHWNPGFLGGTQASEQQIIDNCVADNAWALRQLVQTAPAVLYLVGEASYTMFRRAFGGLLHRDTELDHAPADGAFTLLRETTDPAHPCYIEIDTEVDGVSYHLKTRLVVTPHFSYDSNFVPQIRLHPDDWQELQERDPSCAWALTTDPKITVVPGAQARDYIAFLLDPNQPPGGTASAASAAIFAELMARFPQESTLLRDGFYDPHAQMGGVLVDLLAHGAMGVGPAVPGGEPVLTRTGGSCQFCVNQYWKLAKGCAYGKPNEPAPPVGFLAKVAMAAAHDARGGDGPTPGARHYTDQHEHQRLPVVPISTHVEAGSQQ